MGEQKRRNMKYEELQAILKSNDGAKIREVAVELTKSMIDRGLLIEAGWISLKVMTIPDNAPPIQLQEMRNAFFAGAHHLFNSIMSMLDKDTEPTETDLLRLDKIHAELDQFIKEFKLKHFEASGNA